MMTNLEKIQKYNADKMAEFMTLIADVEPCMFCAYLNKGVDVFECSIKDSEKCLDGFKKWLESEAEP